MVSKLSLYFACINMLSGWPDASLSKQHAPNKNSFLLYADDIVLISHSSEKLQQLLNCLHEWYIKVYINTSKSKVVHFRKSRTKKTSHKMDKEVICLVQQYKYLDILLDEHLKFDLCDDIFAKSGRTLSSLISKCNVNKKFNYDIFTHLFYNCVSHI